MSDNYILTEKHEIVPVSFDEWAKWLKEGRERKILSRNFVWVNDEEIFISTVFLGINHNWGKGEPILFETMIFGGEHDSWQDRYFTFREACEGHIKALNMVMGNDSKESHS